jgi:hypothetical protein
MWFLYGICLGVGGTLLIQYSLLDAVNVPWYGWVLLAFALGLGTLTAHHFFASYRELEPKAGWVGLGLFGIPTALLAGGTVWTFV